MPNGFAYLDELTVSGWERSLIAHPDRIDPQVAAAILQAWS